ncbi:MAG: hypothetical protein ABJM86_03970 [Hyphomicrobiales bacterium]
MNKKKYTKPTLNKKINLTKVVSSEGLGEAGDTIVGPEPVASGA